MSGSKPAADDPARLEPDPVRVLLIDDQPMIGEMVRRILADHVEIELETCSEPVEAIAAADRFRPTVILLDLIMPVVDGLTLLRFFRANEATQEVPIIVLSSKEEPLVKSEAFALGANDYIVKLPDALEFVARIRHHSAGYTFLIQRNAAQEALAASHDVLRRLNDELQVRNRFIQETFGRYLSDDIVDELLEDPTGLELGGEKRTVTIMMADLRGFTSLSERLPPEHVVQMLNLFLGRMADVVMDHGGTIDKFLGDAILAVFGAPVSAEDDALRAVTCALHMQCAMPEINDELTRRGLPAVEMGMALDTGSVVVGNIGSKRRAEYGVIGTHVNLAARIESNTVGGQVLVSQSTLHDAGTRQLLLRDQFAVSAKGFSEPIIVHEVVGLRGPPPIALPTVDQEFRTVQPPLPLTLATLQESHVGQEEAAGLLERLGRSSAAIRSELELAALTDVRLRFLDETGDPTGGEAYAKITRGWDPATSTFELRFTSVPPDVEQMLDRVREQLS